MLIKPACETLPTCTMQALAETVLSATAWGYYRSAGDDEKKHYQHWGKVHLRPSERTGWTRGMDGWRGVGRGSHGTVRCDKIFWRLFTVLDTKSRQQ